MPANSEGRGPDPRRLKKRLQDVARRDRQPEPSPSSSPFAFVAYSHKHEAAALRLVDALVGRGIQVRWDKDLLGGDNFRRSLDELANTAAAVIVIWSPEVSDYVIDEAETGKNRGRLVTCRLRGLDATEVPSGFRGLHCIDVDDIEAILRAIARHGLIGNGAA